VEAKLESASGKKQSMLRPSQLNTTGLIGAVTDRALPADYRDACITELADRIDRPKIASHALTTDQVNDIDLRRTTRRRSMRTKVSG
jgi:hypothetical protein